MLKSLFRSLRQTPSPAPQLQTRLLSDAELNALLLAQWREAPSLERLAQAQRAAIETAQAQGIDLADLPWPANSAKTPESARLRMHAGRVHATFAPANATQISDPNTARIVRDVIKQAAQRPSA